MRLTILLFLLAVLNLKSQDSLTYNKFSFAFETKTGTQFGRVDFMLSGNYNLTRHIGLEIGCFKTNQLGYWDSQYKKGWMEQIVNYTGLYTGRAMPGKGNGFFLSLNEFTAPEGKGFSTGFHVGYVPRFEVSETLFMETLINQWYLKNGKATELSFGIECNKNISFTKSVYAYIGAEWMFSLVNLKGKYEDIYGDDPFNGELVGYQIIDPQLFLKAGFAVKI